MTSRAEYRGRGGQQSCGDKGCRNEQDQFIPGSSEWVPGDSTGHLCPPRDTAQPWAEGHSSACPPAGLSGHSLASGKGGGTEPAGKVISVLVVWAGVWRRSSREWGGVSDLQLSWLEKRVAWRACPKLSLAVTPGLTIPVLGADLSLLLPSNHQPPPSSLETCSSSTGAWGLPTWRESCLLPGQGAAPQRPAQGPSGTLAWKTSVKKGRMLGVSRAGGAATVGLVGSGGGRGQPQRASDNLGEVLALSLGPLPTVLHGRGP